MGNDSNHRRAAAAPVTAILRQAGTRWRPLLLAMCCGAVPLAGAPAALAAGGPPVTAISVERSCSGCPANSLLVLRRDGTATYTSSGNARFGTVSSTATGTVRPEDFDALARLAVAQGFFEFDDTYQNPEIQDGSWTTTSLTRGGTDKRVFSREDAGPPALKAIEAAIEALRASITFKPGPP